MVEFVKSPIYFNWLQKNVPAKRMIICSPFVVKNALKRLINFYSSEIALGEYELIIIIRAKKRDFEQGSSDVAAIEYLHELQKRYPDKIKVKIVNNLHMKAYCVDDTKLLISSGNMTPRGVLLYGTQGNVEGGVATDDENAVKEFMNYFEKIYAAGVDIKEFVESKDFPKIKKQVRKSNPGGRSAKDIGGVFLVDKPQQLLEYPETKKEDSRYKRFEIKNELDFGNVSIEFREYIPQNAVPENYAKAMKFLYENEGENRTMDKLAYYLGTEAGKASTRARKPSGVMANLKLLGLVENENVNAGILPGATPLGYTFYQGDEDLQVEIIREQSSKLPWMDHIRQLRDDNPEEPLVKIITEYLCNKPIEYEESSAKRYRPAMIYFCKLNGIE